MPAVSINVGYLSNVDDDTSLSNEEYVNKVSDALTDAVLEYFTGRNLTE
jgi:N-acetylmuramoyl-L-alanine amidase